MKLSSKKKRQIKNISDLVSRNRHQVFQHFIGTVLNLVCALQWGAGELVIMMIILGSAPQVLCIKSNSILHDLNDYFMTLNSRILIWFLIYTDCIVFYYHFVFALIFVLNFNVKLANIRGCQRRSKSSKRGKNAHTRFPCYKVCYFNSRPAPS